MSIKKQFPQLLQREYEDEDEPDFTWTLSTNSVLKLIQMEMFPTVKQAAELNILTYLINDKQYYQAQLMKQKLQEYYIDDEEYINETKVMFEQLDDDVEEIVELTKWFELNDGWQLQQNDGHMKIRYQQLPNSQRLVARIDTEIKIPLDIFISLIYETELYPHWFPFCKDSTTIVQPDKATKILQIHSSPPIVSDREICCKGWGVNNLDHDGSIKRLNHYRDMVSFSDNPKHVRADLTVFGAKVQPITFDHHIVTVVICVDPKLKYIPDFLPNYFLRKFCGIMFEKLVSNAKTYKGSIWEKKKNESQEFYGWLNEKFKEYETRLKKPQQFQS